MADKTDQMDQKELSAFQAKLKLKPPRRAKPGELMYSQPASKFTIGGQTFVYGDCVEEWPAGIRLKYQFQVAPCKAQPQADDGEE
jgi:hypothetical protein